MGYAIGQAASEPLPPGTGVRPTAPGEVGRTSTGQFYTLGPNGDFIPLPAPKSYAVSAQGKIVVTSAPTNGGPWLDQEIIAGVPNKYLLMGGGGFFLLLTMLKAGRRR